MTHDRKMSAPDAADRHRRLIAFALLALGGLYSVSAIRALVEADLAASLGILELGLALITVGLMVPVFWWKARNWSSGDWHLYKDADGFVAHTIARAQSVSWMFTLGMVVLMKPVADRYGELSVDFFFDVLLALMVLSFSVVFLHMDRDPADDVQDPDHA